MIPVLLFALYFCLLVFKSRKKHCVNVSAKFTFVYMNSQVLLLSVSTPCGLKISSVLPNKLKLVQRIQLHRSHQTTAANHVKEQATVRRCQHN